ncbi:MAG TPA: methyltransferase domain-containing protein [Candidatus Limnocylindria bacterium]|jgi:SAM-dependent methyltransferase
MGRLSFRDRDRPGEADAGDGMLSGLHALLAVSTRADADELLDSGTLTAREVEGNLADLARLNRLPGGTATSVRAIRSLVNGAGGASILDAGTGRADMPIAFARAGWRTVAVDANPQVVRVARRATERHAEIEVVDGDARRLPFADDAFDVAHCSLLLHHLDPDEAVAALRELARVARRGVVVNDLRRGTVSLLATVASTAILARSRVTRADGLVSARRAYTVAELDRLLERAGLRRRWRSPAWMPRVVTAAVPS